MEKKYQVHNLIILDESGSMGSIKNSTIQGFNEIVQTIHGIEKQFPEQEHFITFVSFNGLGKKVFQFADPVAKLQEINSEQYQPDASTPLFDAMGFAINKLRHFLDGKTDYKVLVTILTDGEENSSREFSGNDIKRMVEKLKNENWTFTYIGTDHDVEKIASSLSISNTLSFGKNDEEIRIMFSKERVARTAYASKVFQSESSMESRYFEDEEPSSNR